MSSKHDEEVIRISNNFAEARSHYWHSEGTNDYKNSAIHIEKIVDRKGQVVGAVWQDDWTEVSPGIETRKEKGHHVRIHRHACPVRIQFQRWYEYVSYDDSAYSFSESANYWVRYEAENPS